MRSHTILAVTAVVAVACLGVPAASAQDEGYRHGRLRLAEPGVSLQRASDASAEEAGANEPFLPGDRVWTDANGRADFQFPDGSVVRLDRRSKLDYAGHEEDRGERIALRLWSGSLILRVGPRAGARFEIETPAGTVQGLARSVVRADVDAGALRVSVYAGEAVLDDASEPVRLAAGERSYARWGERAEEPQQFDLEGEEDDFASWDAGQESETRWASGSAEYLPEELDTYSGELDAYGDWRYEESVGRVWAPRVAVGWRPYSNGRWCWTPYGWTWVPYEPWGWAPFHYGRWGHSAAFGWYWMPGRTWGPAWVSWAAGGGRVGWCALGRHDRPVVAWGRRYENRRGFDGRHAVPRSRFGIRDADAWNVVRDGELGKRDLAARRLAVERLEPAALKVASSARLRPTRDLKGFREAEAAPRAISTRQTPGDFVRELAVDNKTTIPSPWFRRGDGAVRGDGTVRYKRGEYVGAAARSRGRDGEPAGTAVAPESGRSPAEKRYRPQSSGGSRPSREGSGTSRGDGGRGRSSGGDGGRGQSSGGSKSSGSKSGGGSHSSGGSKGGGSKGGGSKGH